MRTVTAIVTLCLPVLLLAASQNHLSDKAKGKWEATAEIPMVKGSSPVQRLAARDIVQGETKWFQHFIKIAHEDFKDDPNPGLNEWSYEAGGTVTMNRPDLVSIDAGCYSYMGGAHGLGTTRTYNYGLVEGKAKRLTLWDIVQKMSRQEMRLILLGKATATEGTDWIQDGMINDFTDEQYNRFWIAKDALVFEFDPYELGSYASGPFTFRIPFSELKQILRPAGPLKGLMAKKQ
jgi:hypothetical protein